MEIRAAEMIMDVKEFERRLNIATLLLMWCDGKTICQFFEDYKQSFFVLLASSQKEVTMAMKTVLHQFFICGADMAPHYEVFHSFFVDTEALKRFYEIDNIESEREFISFFVKTFYLPIFHFIESNCFFFTRFENLDATLDITLLNPLVSFVVMVHSSILFSF